MPPAASSIRAARGVNEDEYLPAAKLGVTKVNIDTDGRLVWTRVHREFFRDNPARFDFRPPGKIFVRGIREVHRAQKRQARLGGSARGRSRKPAKISAKS